MGLDQVSILKSSEVFFLGGPFLIEGSHLCLMPYDNLLHLFAIHILHVLSTCSVELERLSILPAQQPFPIASLLWLGLLERLTDRETTTPIVTTTFILLPFTRNNKLRGLRKYLTLLIQ